MAGFAKMGTMDIWYAHLSEQEIMAAIATMVASQKGKAKKEAEKRAEGAEDRGESTHARQPAGAVEARGARGRQYRIVSQPPIVIPVRELEAFSVLSADEVNRPFTSSSAPTDPRSRMTGATCSSVSRSSTSPARSWVSAASAHGRSSSCSRGAIRRIPCSSRSRRRRPRCWRITCPRAGTSSTVNGSCRGNG